MLNCLESSKVPLLWSPELTRKKGPDYPLNGGGPRPTGDTWNKRWGELTDMTVEGQRPVSRS